MPQNRVIPVFIPHAGCPFDCVFCDQRTISGHIFPPSPQEVENIISEALNKLSEPAELAFYGGSFTCLPYGDQEKYLLAAKPFIENGKLARIRVSTRPDAIDEDILDLLSSYGVETIELGAQSMDNNVLKCANRGHSGEAVETASRLIKERGFKLILQLMFGLPGDTAETARKTCTRAAALDPDGVRFYPTVVIKGTKLHQMMLSGEYSPISVEEAVELCAKLLPIFTEKDIPVIRLGLNPTDELSNSGSVAGGAYHPALGELVWSRFFYNMAREKLLGSDVSGKTVSLFVHPRRLSVMAGQHRCNSKALTTEFNLKKLRILPQNSKENTVSVLVEE
ncbi:MAG: radical SAM protein [Oscillospiraceae bacterium]|nr:radical SAM protein [Oscillospiraceae bacterium]